MSDPIGHILRTAREDCRLTTTDIAKITRIPEASIFAMEEGNFDSLPAPVFVRGFIRAYCREVDLEPDEVLGRYDTHLHENELKNAEEQDGNLGPLLLSGPEVGGAHRGLQISHVLLLLLALATFIIAYVTAGVPSSEDPASNEASTTHQTTTTSSSSNP